MSDICGKIQRSLSKNCNDITVSGINARVILINKDDVSTITYDPLNSKIVTAITLKTTSPATVAFSFTGINNRANGAMCELVVKKFRKSWKHTLDLLVLDCSPEAHLWVEELKDGQIIAIVQNVYDNKNADAHASSSVFEILGIEQGLELSAATKNNIDVENGNSWVLKAASHDEALEPENPKFFYVTDKATTLLAVEALLG